MATLTDAQLTAIADNIFVMRPRSATKLSPPVATAAGPFKTALDPIATQHDFLKSGIAVIDFTKSVSAPDVWLHNPTKTYRIGSASKIAMLLAAMQLRLEVRKILAMSPKPISTAAEFDALYANPKLWAKAKAPRSELSGISATPPQISQIFDFTKTPVDFAGPDPNSRIDAHGQPDAAKQAAVMAKLSGGHLDWKDWSSLTFSERLWLAGCVSDNVAATSCVCQIGIPYIKAVQRAYGLQDNDPKKGMHLFASRGYGPDPPRSAKPPDVPPPRALSEADVEPLTVEDAFDAGGGRFTDMRSWVPGTAAALAAYMIAMQADSLVNDGSVALFGKTGCDTLRNNLADGGAQAISSFLADDGVKKAPNTKILRQINKIGILKKSDLAKAQLICEFVYLETQQDPKPATGREFMKYAVVAVGLISEVDEKPPGHSSNGKAALLGFMVHQALQKL
jgi:hypothetical protein